MKIKFLPERLGTSKLMFPNKVGYFEALVANLAKNETPSIKPRFL